MRTSAITVGLAATLSMQACTIALPVTVGVRAHHHNQRVRAAAAGQPVPRERLHDVGGRCIAATLGGIVIDGLLLAVFVSVVYGPPIGPSH